MSEYQYFEFRAIDRALTESEQEVVSGLSSRVSPHPRKAVFTYSYSDFPADEIAIVANYFDFMFYTANWGDTRLILRFPKGLIPLEEIKPFRLEYFLEYHLIEDFILIDISLTDREELDDVWYESMDEADALLPLRDDIMRGDYRALYLGWLALTRYDREDGMIETFPPVPAGLSDLTPALNAFIEIFGIDKRTVRDAVEKSPKRAELTVEKVKDQIEKLTDLDIKDWLLRLAKGEEPNLSLKFQKFLAQKE